MVKFDPKAPIQPHVPGTFSHQNVLDTFPLYEVIGRGLYLSELIAGKSHTLEVKIHTVDQEDVDLIAQYLVLATRYFRTIVKRFLESNPELGSLAPDALVPGNNGRTLASLAGLCDLANLLSDPAMLPGEAVESPQSDEGHVTVDLVSLNGAGSDAKLD